MSLITVTHFSKSFSGCAQVNIILPIGMEYEDMIEPGEKFQTLWLLHGRGGNYSEWARYTGIERLAMNHKFAVVMTDGANSGYNDQPDGRKYYTYLREELPHFLRKHFPLSDRREDNFIAGLSMGGFGAAKLGFNNPHLYAAIGILSAGPWDPIRRFAAMNPEKAESESKYTYGPLSELPGSVNDVYKAFADLKKSGKPMPLIYTACGTEDFIYPNFQAFRKFVRETGAEKDVLFEEAEGVHSWDFWDEYIAKFIGHLPLKNRGFWRRWYDSVEH